PTPGPACRVSEDQLNELAANIEAGPDLVEHGVVRYRLCDLCALAEQRFGESKSAVNNALYQLS
ncbi:MAG: hypothetical protein ACR2RE_22795, partial [Geminicoccaceae bacterium]